MSESEVTGAESALWLGILFCMALLVGLHGCQDHQKPLDNLPSSNSTFVEKYPTPATLGPS